MNHKTISSSLIPQPVTPPGQKAIWYISSVFLVLDVNISVMIHHVTLDKYNKQLLLHLYYAAMIDESRIGAVC